MICAAYFTLLPADLTPDSICCVRMLVPMNPDSKDINFALDLKFASYNTNRCIRSPKTAEQFQMRVDTIII